MEIPFARLLLHHSRLLQEVVRYDATHRVSLVVELDVHVLAESAGVVVAICFGISECLQDSIALDENVLNSER